MRSAAHVRSAPAAFTLLEVVLSLAIGLLLMGALYTAMRVQLKHAQAGRTVVEQGTFVRGLLARLEADITSNLAPISPATLQVLNKQANQANGSAGGGAGGAGGGSGNTGTGSQGGTAGGSGTAAGASATGASSTGASVLTSGQTAGVIFNYGVEGDQSRLTLYVSRFPRELPFGDTPANQDQPVPVGVADLRRITYWMAEAGKGGLARQELKHPTSDDLSNIPPAGVDEASAIIAEEVKSVTFSYFDGTNWQTSWDGTVPGPDGVTPMGPPVAVGIELTIQFPDAREPKRYRHVVVIPTANGPGQPSLNTNGSSNSSNPSTTGGSGP
jgi:hypothetical protein